jgi:hypothetical protein
VRFSVTDRLGGSDPDPPVERVREVLAELDHHDRFHPSAWLRHESGWLLEAHADGTLVWWCDDEPGCPFTHMRSVPRGRVLELWLQLARGEVAEIAGLAWLPGDGRAEPSAAADGRLDSDS